MDDFTVYFTIQMQILIAVNRISAVAAKHKHKLIFSKRNGLIMIAFAAILAAVYCIPVFTNDVEINPYIYAVWFVKEPSYVQVYSQAVVGIVCSYSAILIVIYAIAYVKLR